MDEKKFNSPDPGENQWLKELFDSADDQQETDPENSALNAEDEAWLQELFASAEQAAEKELSQKEPEEAEEEPPLFLDFDQEQWPAEQLPQQAAVQEEPSPAQQTPTPAFPELFVEDEESEFPLDYDDDEVNPADEDEDEDENEDEDEEFDPDAFSDDPSVAKRKRRPRNTRGYGLFGIPHIAVTAIWLAIIVTFGVFLGQWLWQGAKDVLAFGREDHSVTITVTEDDDLESLIGKLHSAGLIHEPMWFRWYGQLTDVMEDVGVGTFELNTLYDYHALVSHMSSSSTARVTVRVKVPSGYTCAQMFALLEEKGVCTASALEEAAMYGELNTYWFLEGVERDHKYCLEGYLFPDTYEFYVGDNPTRVLNKFLSNFNTRFTDIMEAKLDVLNGAIAERMRANGLSEEYIAAHPITIREVVIIASLIEKEAASSAEGYTVSSVIYNRLTNPTVYPYLDIDAALVYITGKNTLTDEDKALDSPYNTYLYPGLIPGPIANPSRASLDAALDPLESEYYFYAFDPATGFHHFSATYAEHQAFLESLKEEAPETP